MRRALTALAGVVAGGLVAAAGLAGSDAAVRPAAEPLGLAAYCRHLYGDDATAYLPRRVDGWSCSAWRNGVWRLETADLHAACRWQRGDAARLGEFVASEREVLCTR